MKTILACLDPDNYFRIVLDDRLLRDVGLAKNWLSYCPWDGELWINVDIYWFNAKKNVPSQIVINKEFVQIQTLSIGEKEYLLEWGDDLLSLPPIYLTRRYRLFQKDAEKLLSQSDIDLVHTWEEFHAKMLAE